MNRLLFIPSPHVLAWLPAPVVPPREFIRRVVSGEWQPPFSVRMNLQIPPGTRYRVVFHGRLGVVTPDRPLPPPQKTWPAELTPEQNNILGWMGEGKTTRWIAHALKRRPRYVQYQIAEIKRYFSAHSREQAVRRGDLDMGSTAGET